MDRVAAARGAIVCFQFDLVELRCYCTCDGVYSKTLFCYEISCESVNVFINQNVPQSNLSIRPIPVQHNKTTTCKFRSVGLCSYSHQPKRHQELHVDHVPLCFKVLFSV